MLLLIFLYLKCFIFAFKYFRKIIRLKQIVLTRLINIKITPKVAIININSDFSTKSRQKNFISRISQIFKYSIRVDCGNRKSKTQNIFLFYFHINSLGTLLIKYSI